MAIFAVSLGFLPGGSNSIGNYCSADGSVVVGQAGDSGGDNQAVYWGAGNVIHLLPAIGTGINNNQAFACTPDGTIIVGVSTDNSNDLHAVTWTGGPSWAVNDLGFLGTGNISQALGCSSDGLVVVGVSSKVPGAQPTFPTVWNSGAPAELPTPVGTTQGQANCCSANGGIIFGSFTDASATVHPAMWTGGPSWALTELPSLPGGLGASFSTSVNGCSANGSLAVGTGADSFGSPNAVFWNLAIDLFGSSIGGPGSGAVFSDASGLNVTGSPSSPGPDGTAAMWLSGVGQYLPKFAGAISVDGASGVSTDGTVVVGVGTDGSGFQVAVKWTGIPTPTPPPPAPSGFLVCNNAWTIAQPKSRLYGLDHLIGREVVGLADGVPVGPLTVAADGSVTLPFAASYVTLGLNFTVQLQTPYLDTGNPTIQGRRKNITAATIRVDASAAPFTGTNQPDGGSFTPTRVDPVWTNMQPSVTQDPEQFPETYVGPGGQTVTQLFSGDFRANLQPGWDTRGQIAVEQTLPLPLAVTAIEPEALFGDLPEQTISLPQGGQEPPQESRGPGMWMLTSRGRR